MIIFSEYPDSNHCYDIAVLNCIVFTNSFARMKYFVTALVLLFSVTTAFSQITLTYDQYLEGFANSKTGDSYTSTDTSGLRTIINTSGPNQSWDLGGRVYSKLQSDGTITVFTYPGNAPLASDPDLTSSTHVQKYVPSDPTQPTIYSFFKIDQTGEYQTGTVQDSMGTVTKIFGYSPAEQLFKFPLTYQTSWTSSSDLHVNIGIPGVTASQKLDAVVDAFGSLILPTAIVGKNPVTSTTQTLRLKRTLTQTISFGGFGGYSSTTNTFEWLSTSNSAAITADSALNPIDITYTNTAATGSVSSSEIDNPLTIRIGSNPVNTTTSLFVNIPTVGETSISFSDALGKNIIQVFNGFASTGSMTLPLNVNQLSNGTYFLRVQSSGYSAMRKVIVSH
jgi:hypothetical protein